MEDESRQEKEGYTAQEIIVAYQAAMSFWNEFWHLASRKLGYPHDFGLMAL
jgi:hypothetical protein